MKAKLGILDLGGELDRLESAFKQYKTAQERILKIQKELVVIHAKALDQARERLAEMRKQLETTSTKERNTDLSIVAPQHTGGYSPAPSDADVSLHSWNSESEYLMSGAIRPPTPEVTMSASPPDGSKHEDAGPASATPRGSQWMTVVRRMRTALHVWRNRSH